MMKPFICNQGQNRSRTAAELFGGMYADIYSNKHPATAELTRASEIFVFEEHQRKWIGEHFPKQYLMKKMTHLVISDMYAYVKETIAVKLKNKLKFR